MSKRSFQVLVATDGSPSARAALATAIAFPWSADASGSVVVARHVRPEYRRRPALALLDRTSEVVARHASRAMAKRWPGAGTRLVDAPPVEAILKEAKRVAANVIVMGWRGHGPVRRLLTGSVSRGVVRRASAAVLVVRRPIQDLRHLVLGLDGSDNADRAVGFVKTLPPAQGRRVTLFRAIDVMHVPSHPLAPSGALVAAAEEVARINDERRKTAQRELTQAAKTLSSAGWTVEQVITEGAPLRELLATVTSTGADMVVVGARGVTGLRRLLLGSVAEGALNRSPVPVLIVR